MFGFVIKLFKQSFKFDQMYELTTVTTAHIFLTELNSPGDIHPPHQLSD